MSICRRLFSPCLLFVAVLCVGCPTDPDDGFGRTTPAAGIRGTICTPDGINEVNGAFVTLHADEDEDGVADDFTALATAMTDWNGAFLLEGIGGGTYVAIARKGHRSFTFPVTSSGGIQQRLERECFPGDSASVAVIAGSCDSPDTLYNALGYQTESLDADDLSLLTNPAALNAWDVLIAPCGMPSTWLPQAETVSETLGGWLEGGGSLYVSGDAWPLLEAVDEELIDWVGDDEDPTAANVGFGATVQAMVMEPSLAEAVGGTAQIVFEDNWSMIEQVGEGWSPLASGTVQTVDGTFFENSPLAVSRFRPEGGIVIYSSFGTVGATEDMSLLLSQWLIEL